MQINITDLQEKYEKICVKIYVEYFKKLHDKKLSFATKLNTSTEHDLEFLMLLTGNSLQNVTFFRKNPQKVIEE